MLRKQTAESIVKVNNAQVRRSGGLVLGIEPNTVLAALATLAMPKLLASEVNAL